MTRDFFSRKEKVSKFLAAYEFLLGMTETVLGWGILVYGRKLFELYIQLRDDELLIHPNKYLVRISEVVIPNLFERRYYVVLLLLGLGIIKIIAAIGMFKQRRWGAILLSFLIFSLLPFEIVAILYKFSWMKVLYLAINVTIILYVNQSRQVKK